MLQHSKIKSQEDNSRGTSWQSIGRDCTSTTWGLSSIPSWGTKIRHAVWCNAPKETVESCELLPLQKEAMEFFWPHHLAQVILIVSLPGTEPASLSVKARSYPWTNREVLKTVLEYSKWVGNPSLTQHR